METETITFEKPEAKVTVQLTDEQRRWVESKVEQTNDIEEGITMALEVAGHKQKEVRREIWKQIRNWHPQTMGMMCDYFADTGTIRVLRPEPKRRKETDEGDEPETANAIPNAS